MVGIQRNRHQRRRHYGNRIGRGKGEPARMPVRAGSPAAAPHREAA